jgi:hypothetical protein
MSFADNMVLAIGDFSNVRGNFPILGDSASNQYQLNFGTSVIATNASGDATITSGLTTLNGFMMWNGDSTARPNAVFGNTRANFPAVANGSVTVRGWTGNTAALLASVSVRYNWLGWGIV